MLRDKIVLDLFENPYVGEDPIEIRKVAAESTDLSRRLAAQSVTLLTRPTCCRSPATLKMPSFPKVRHEAERDAGDDQTCPGRPW